MTRAEIFRKAYQNVPEEIQALQAAYEARRAQYVQEGVKAGLFKRSKARFSGNPDEETAPPVEPLMIAPIKEILDRVGL